MPFDPGPFNLRSGVNFFFPSLAWEEKIIDYRDKGRGHDGRLGPFSKEFGRFDPSSKSIRST